MRRRDTFFKNNFKINKVKIQAGIMLQAYVI